MGHSADSERPGSKRADIEILQQHEAVRRRPAGYLGLGSTDLPALPRLLQFAVRGVLWHSRYLEEAPDQIIVSLASDGGATVSSSKAAPSSVFLEQSSGLLREECTSLYLLSKQARPFFHLREIGALSELFVVNALSDPLWVGIREGESHWRSFQFRRGLFLKQEERSLLPDPERAIQIHFYPDLTVLGPATWNPKQVQRALHALSKDFPFVPLTVSDPR